MSTFATPIIGLDLTKHLNTVWNITDEYSNEIVGLLYSILQNENTALRIYCPNGEDWYEIYYGVDIDQVDIGTDVQALYQDHLKNISNDFANIFNIIVNPKFSNKEHIKSLISAFDALTVQECVAKLAELRDYIKNTPPKYEAIFSF